MKKEKILIVEDELDLLDLVDFNLTRKGFLTAGAIDGLEAMEKIDSFKPDIIVLDLMLPKLDGWEICRRLRQNKNYIPVIMLTAKCMPEDKVKGLEFGADDYVTKPFSIKELIIRIDKQLEKKRKNELQNMLFHEMSNKMHAIGSYSRLLSAKEPAFFTDKDRSYLHNIGREINYTTEFLHEVYSLMKIETSELDFRIGKYDLRALISAVAESCTGLAVQKNITIRLNLKEFLPDVDADLFSLKQILSNLIGNSVKYGRENGYVEVAAKTSTEGIFISVKDDGLGIPAKDLPHIFDKGYRAGNVPDYAKGSGLGLYIVKLLADMSGLRIETESAEGYGSEFLIRFGPPKIAGTLV